MRFIRGALIGVRDVMMLRLRRSTLLAIGIGQSAENRIQPVDHGHQRVPTKFTQTRRRPWRTSKTSTSTTTECCAAKSEPAIWRTVRTMGETGTGAKPERIVVIIVVLFRLAVGPGVMTYKRIKG